MQGLGNPDGWLQILIGNRPECPPGLSFSPARPLRPRELDQWLATNSNHWRKIFNLAAKLMFELEPGECQTWQDYRDSKLLTANCNCLLIFRPEPDVLSYEKLQLISGKQCAEQLINLASCEAIAPGFHLHKTSNTLVTPYFDYRQLSNDKLRFLAKEISALRRA